MEILREGQLIGYNRIVVSVERSVGMETATIRPLSRYLIFRKLQIIFIRLRLKLKNKK
jgi:hypothetical protein